MAAPQRVTNSPHLLPRPPSEYTIVIPTKGRWRPACIVNRKERALAGVQEPFILRKTLSLLDQQEIPKEKVYLFVNGEVEEEQYRSALARSAWKDVKIIVGVDGIMEQRNFITKYFDEGAHIVSIDDDVDKIYFKAVPYATKLEILPPGGLQGIIFDAAARMKIFTKAHLWGLNSTASANVRNMHVDGISTRCGEVNGFLYGFRNRHMDELLPRFSNATEDAERSVRYFAVDSIVMRYRMYCCETRCYENGGGLQTTFGQENITDSIAHSNIERKKAELKSARQMHEAFPKLVDEPREREQAKTLAVVFRSVGGPVIPSTTAEALRENGERPVTTTSRDTGPRERRAREPRAKRARVVREESRDGQLAGGGSSSSASRVPLQSPSPSSGDEHEDEDDYDEEAAREEQQLFDAMRASDAGSNEERLYQAWLRSYNGDFENAFEEAVNRSEADKRIEEEEKRKEDELLRIALSESQEEVSTQICEKVPQLIEMGFTAERAESALRETAGNLELAMEKLLCA